MQWCLKLKGLSEGKDEYIRTDVILLFEEIAPDMEQRQIEEAIDESDEKKTTGIDMKLCCLSGDLSRRSYGALQGFPVVQRERCPPRRDATTR
ncbi:uncharacterized protein LOC112141219 [Tachysurus ichikawai]